MGGRAPAGNEGLARGAGRAIEGPDFRTPFDEESRDGEFEEQAHPHQEHPPPEVEGAEEAPEGRREELEEVAAPAARIRAAAPLDALLTDGAPPR